MTSTSPRGRVPARSLALCLSAFILLVAAPSVRAADDAPLSFDFELALRRLDGTHSLDIPGTYGWAYASPTIATSLLEGRAGVAYQASALRWEAELSYAHSADLGEASTFIQGSGTMPDGSSFNYWSTSSSQGSLQAGELRLGAEWRLAPSVEAGPWVSARLNQLDLGLGDTSETLSVNGAPSSGFQSGSTFTYRATGRSAWVGLAATWSPFAALRLGGEAALSPWSSDRVTLDNLVKTIRTTSDLKGTGWRAGAGAAWVFATGHRVALRCSMEQITSIGTGQIATYAGPNQGQTQDGDAKLVQDAWDVAVSWGYAF